VRVFGKHVDGNLAALVVVGVALSPIPLFLSGVSQEGIAVRLLLFALFGVAWNVMGGFAGQFSFGHAAFFGIGAYTTAVLSINSGLSPWVGMALGAVLAAAFGLVTGFLSFRYRVKGAYFALATFAFAEMLQLIVSKLEPLNGARGFRVPLLLNPSWGALQFEEGSPNYYYVILALLIAAILAVTLLMKSRAGAYILAVRDDEAAAEAVGINPMRYKLIAVCVSAALTAVAGAFYFEFYFFINPELAFGPAVSVAILLPAIVGGVGTIWGPVVGGVLIGALAEASQALVRQPPEFLSFLQGHTGLDLMIYGAILVLVILFLPRGLYAGIRRKVGYGASTS
jgi:branched-chain amino acid transport system permease protein